MIELDLTPLKNITVLYVDDEEDILLSQERILSRFTNVITAKDGEMALEMLKTHQIDIVITDIQMPNINGIELLKRIRSDEGMLPVVIVSAFNDEDILLKAIEYGAQKYIFKPIDTAILKNTLLDLSQTVLLKKELASSQRLLKEYQVALDRVALVSQATIDGKIFYANSNFLEACGYSLEELQEHGYRLISHPDAPKAFFDELKESIKEHQIYHGVIKNRSKNGVDYFVESTVVPLDDNCIISFDYEVTEREMKQIEKNAKIIKMRAKAHSDSMVQITALNQRISYLQQEIAALLKERAKLSREIEIAKARANSAEEQLIKLTAQNETLTTNHRVVLGKISQLEDRNRQLNRLLESISSRS